jgi:hypothetical protein
MQATIGIEKELDYASILKYFPFKKLSVSLSEKLLNLSVNELPQAPESELN